MYSQCRPHIYLALRIMPEEVQYVSDNAPPRSGIDAAVSVYEQACLCRMYLKTLVIRMTMIVDAVSFPHDVTARRRWS